jgi:hypothetical protein
MDEQTRFTTESAGTINAYSAKFDSRSIQFVDNEDEKSLADLDNFKLLFPPPEPPEPDDREAKVVRKRIKSVNRALFNWGS